MDDRNELELWLSLVRGRNPCLRELNRRLRTRGPRMDLMDLEPRELTQFIASVADASVTAPDEAIHADLRWLEGSADRFLLPIGDPRYPWLLRQIPDPPLLLFVEGDPSCLSLPCLSIVGSRNPTPQGREISASFARRLADLGFTIVSGLALGIDGCAHRGALETGSTVGVCAHGLDTVYPHAHRQLAAAIRERGALVSEFPTGVRPRRHNFPQRNRIISGMSVGTLVVEAGLRSGSLITARFSAEQNREVFAVPGSIHSPQSRGCHDLIKNGARLVESLEDVFQELGQYSRHVAEAPRAGSAVQAGHARFLDCMGYAPCTPDELVRRSGLTSGEVSSMLLVLELDGWVELCPGGTYVRVAGS
ncbi:MAG: DNA-processing protein DprA [Arenicellales bacterium]